MSKDNEGLQSRMSMTIERLHSEIAKENQILIQENRTVPSMVTNSYKMHIDSY